MVCIGENDIYDDSNENFPPSYFHMTLHSGISINMPLKTIIIQLIKVTTDPSCISIIQPFFFYY